MNINFVIDYSNENFNQEQMSLITRVKEASGKKDFTLPNIFSFKICNKGIILTIKTANLDYIGMTHVYDIDWYYPIAKYSFVFYKYVLEEKGKVFIDIEGKRDLPSCDIHNSSKQENYFMFLYRLLKLEKCYTWIVLSDTTKKAVHNFERDLIRMNEMGDSLIRAQYKQRFWKYDRPLIYHERILHGVNDSGRLREILVNVSNGTWKTEDVKQGFSVNLYRAYRKYKNRCFDADDIDFWSVKDNIFYGLNLYFNSYDSMIEKIFFYANYIGDLMEGGLFENTGQRDEVLYNIKEALLIVVMTKKQGDVFFDEWMEFSKTVVDKVKIKREILL